MHYDLTSITLLIPIRISHAVRRRNLQLVLDYLTAYFRINAIVFESDSKPKCSFVRDYQGVSYEFERSEGPFHRTRMLNEMTLRAKTTHCLNHDADVILPVASYVLACRAIAVFQYDFFWPYSQQFFPRRNITPRGKKSLKDNCFSLDRLQPRSDYQQSMEGRRLSKPAFYGGAVFFDREAYLRLGLENEYFVDWGGEDGERWNRIRRFGKYAFLDTIFGGKHFIYHLCHPRTADSQQTYLQGNKLLMRTLAKLDDNRLREYYRQVPYLSKYGISAFPAETGNV